MKYSLNWIKEHIEGTLPEVPELRRHITMNAFEVEDVETHTGDSIFDIKILPDRAHDALSHRGIAREIATLCHLKQKQPHDSEILVDEKVEPVRVTVVDSTFCPRYISLRIDDVLIKDSPKDIIHKLEAIGSRSINNIVDSTNIVLFDIGQPMHAFDAGRVVGGITVRLASAGETMETLDNKQLTFDGTELVIADDEGVLALAGIKGGKKAEVTKETTSIILESANFHSSLVRRTSTKFGIKTDASKRYENGITSNFAIEGITMAMHMLKKQMPNARVGALTDIYGSPESLHTISLTLHEINQLLGTNMRSEDVFEILEKLGVAYTDTEEGNAYSITIPHERLDLRIKEDMIEEIGRHFGYEYIPSTPPVLAQKGSVYKQLYYANMVRAILLSRGFSEVVTYSFATDGEGDIEVANPVGQNRPFLRRALSSGLSRALTENAYYAPLLGVEDIHIFEFGNVFTKDAGEQFHFAVAQNATTKSKIKTLDSDIAQLFNDIAIALQATTPWGIVVEKVSTNGSIKFSGVVYEANFDSFIEALPEPTNQDGLNGYPSFQINAPKISPYVSSSVYPFIVRDIALFVPASIDETIPEQIITGILTPLAVNFYRFDKFQKEGEDRVSYGYRIVFQAKDRTLTDIEVNAEMEKVSAVCNAQMGWQVR